MREAVGEEFMDYFSLVTLEFIRSKRLIMLDPSGFGNITDYQYLFNLWIEKYRSDYVYYLRFDHNHHAILPNSDFNRSILDLREQSKNYDPAKI